MSKAAALQGNLSAEALLLAAVLGWTTALGNTPPGTPGVVATTSPVTRTIDAAAPGTPIDRNIIGNASHLDPSKPAAYEKLWAVLDDTAARGIAGGLDADTYNWKDMSGACVGHTGSPGPNVQTTLSWLKRARDHNSTAILTVNCRGTGPMSASGCCRFYYTDTSVAPW